MSEGVEAGRIHKPQCAEDASLAEIVVKIRRGQELALES